MRTRTAVMAAIEALGYERPSTMRPRSFGLVGLIVPELQNPIFPLYAEVIETNLARHGFTAMLGRMTPEGSGEDEYVGMLLDRKVSGIVFVSGLHADTRVDRSRYDDLARLGVPFVLVNGQVPGLGVPSLSSDDALAARLAVQHVAGLGHRRIGFLSGPERYSTVQRRLAGFRLAIGAAAARALADQVKGRGDGGGERLFDPELVIRDSTGPCPTGLGAGLGTGLR